MNNCVVRLTTSYWYDKNGAYLKKQLKILKRKSSGYQLLIEDCEVIGAEEVMPLIINLNEVDDGIYELVTCNEQKDWETGYLDNYDYKLVKYDDYSTKK